VRGAQIGVREHKYTLINTSLEEKKQKNVCKFSVSTDIAFQMLESGQWCKGEGVRCIIIRIKNSRACTSQFDTDRGYVPYNKDKTAINVITYRPLGLTRQTLF
jgi:hypothetical protein